MTITAKSKQLIILHLSDIHFGSGHRFLADKTTTGAIAPERVPDLLASIKADLQTMDVKYDTLIVVVSGDLTVSAHDNEFTDCRHFVEGLLSFPIFGTKVQKTNVFVVPGNHDVRYDQNTHESFWKCPSDLARV